jgi:hypothetical protein
MTIYYVKSGFPELNDAVIEVDGSGTVTSYINGIGVGGRITGKRLLTDFTVNFATSNRAYHVKSGPIFGNYVGLANDERFGLSKDSIETWIATATTRKMKKRSAAGKSQKGKTRSKSPVGK